MKLPTNIIYEKREDRYIIRANITSGGALSVKVYEIIDLANVKMIWNDHNIVSAHIFVNAQKSRSHETNPETLR